MSYLQALLEMSFSEAEKFMELESGMELDKQYRKLAMKYHPDRGGSDADMKKLNQAYELLKKTYRSGQKVRTREDIEKDMEHRREEEMERKKKLAQKLKFIVTDYKKRFEDVLPEFKTHLSDYFEIGKPEIEVKEHYFEVKKYSSYPSVTMNVKFSNNDGTTNLEIRIRITNRLGSGGLSYGDEIDFSVDFDTLVYHNRKDHKMARRTYQWGKSANEILVPEMVFPAKKLKKVLSREAKKMTKKDFESALKSEFGKKYGMRYFNDRIIFDTKRSDNLVIEMYRSVFMRTPAWNLNIRRLSANGSHLSGAMIKGRDSDFPSNIETSFFIFEEASESIDQLKEFIIRFITGKKIEKDHFKKNK